MKFLLIYLILAPVLSSSQTLSLDRIKKIKSATVQVIAQTAEGSYNGTAFFIDPKGTLVTCWHVIAPVLTHKPSRILIKFNDGFTEMVDISPFQINNPDAQIKASTFDYCILQPIQKITHSFTFLTLGSFSDVDEGREVYTCGYPLRSSQPFITRGMVSSKYNQKISNSLTRQQALADMTMNTGNSGGAIILIADDPANDVVVGIADFIINPIGDQVAKELIESASFLVGTTTYEERDEKGNILRQADPNANTLIISKVVANMSNGISGFVSINHLLEALPSMKN